MPEDKFLMLSLNEEKSKQLAEAISNKSARKIIDYLTDHEEATETELSEKLNLPLPTVHYNIKALKEARLVSSREFYWSQKGKKMRVYKLSNKLVIIAPSNDITLVEKLKSIMPVAVIGTLFAGIVKFLQTSNRSFTQGLVQEDMEVSAPQKIADALTESNLSTFTQLIQGINVTWFLVGLYLALIIYLIARKR